MAVRSESRLFEFESSARHCSCVYLAHPAFLLLSELSGKEATCAGCRLHLEAQGRRNYAQSYALVSFMGMMLEKCHHYMGHMLTHSEARWNLALNSQHFHHVDLAVN